MDEELHELLSELLEYFEMSPDSDNEFYPTISIFSKGGYHTGPVEEHLYETLLALKEYMEGVEIE